MLIVSRKKSESILIGGDIEVIVTEVGADRRSCAKSFWKHAT